jgi:hypothetical protein
MPECSGVRDQFVVVAHTALFDEGDCRQIADLRGHWD